MYSNLLCPNCESPLIKESITFKCTNNHSFDLAKEGYLNLLLVNQKSSLNPGDDADMVNARRNFLEKKYYAPLENKITEVIKKYLEKDKTNELKVLDCGCGEGYYLNSLADHIKQNDSNVYIYGIDISKQAVRLAASFVKKGFFLVSNLNYKFPFLDNSIDIILNIFSPKNPTEFHRVLTKNGILIVVFPTRNHLKELKAKLEVAVDYDNKPENLMSSFSKKFKLIDTEQIELTINLKAEDAKQLVKMTPLYWQIDQKKLDKLGNISTEIGFNIYVLKKMAHIQSPSPN